RAPNRLRRRSFARMRRQPQSINGGVSIHAAKKFRRSLLLVAANSNANNIPVLIAHRQLKNFLRLFHAKMPRRIKNPEQGNAKVPRAPRTSSLQAFKDRGEILLTKKAHTHRHI